LSLGCILWDVFYEFITKVPLKKVYKSSFQDSSTELDCLTGFFYKILEIGNIDWVNIISKLKKLKSQLNITGEVVRRLYSILFEKLLVLEHAK
jgi:hypothetical protein